MVVNGTVDVAGLVFGGTVLGGGTVVDSVGVTE